MTTIQALAAEMQQALYPQNDRWTLCKHAAAWMWEVLNVTDWDGREVVHEAIEALAGAADLDQARDWLYVEHNEVELARWLVQDARHFRYVDEVFHLQHHDLQELLAHAELCEKGEIFDEVVVRLQARLDAVEDGAA